MRNLIWKILLIAGLLGLFVLSIYPPGERIRLGKDLRGGVSLIYAVHMPQGATDPQAILTQVITVLQERVNPKGVLDISMQPLGQDRIEIVMPVPNEEVRTLRIAYEDARDALLREARIPPSQLQTALETKQAVQRFGGEGIRRQRITLLQEAYDELQSAWDALDKAEQAGDSPQDLRPLQQAVADAEVDFDDLRLQVLRLSLDRSRMERALRLSDKREPLRDESGKQIEDAITGELLTKPSQRDIELQNLKDEFPHLADDLEGVAAAYDAYAAKRTGFDDPQDLMRLLRGAGVLEFHIAVRASDPQGVNPDDLRTQLAERGPLNTDSLVAGWFPINDLKQWYDTPQQLADLQADPVVFFGRSRPGGLDLVAAERDGQYFLLLYITDQRSMTHEGDRKWSIVSTNPTSDNLGRPAISFRLDAPGGALMNRLTGPHVGEPMAIVLDGQVYSAPTLQSQIGSQGVITGTFSVAELSYLTRVLAAGSLGARLSPNPIAINTLGPSIGEDNLNRGLNACLIAIVAVVLFMMVYYFFAGMVAAFALLANGVFIFGFMAFINGTFTLPGLAGIVLTIGMAVDANVLIYERIREELVSGDVDLRVAIRVGYGKALSTIIDANVTNLIVCFVLFRTATTEVKGFALTLSIGICATLFTALFVTRVIYELYTDVAKFRRLPMLPTVFPAIDRMLHPNIDWMGLRKVFWVLSALAIVGAVTLVAARGVDMFDTELRGGVSVTIRTAVIDDDRDGEPDLFDQRGDPVRRWLPHTGQDGVETRVRRLATLFDPQPTGGEQTQQRTRLLSALRSAGVIDRATGDLPPIDQFDRDPQLSVVLSILHEMGKASVLTVGRTEIRDGIVHCASFQIKVASPKNLSEEETITDVVVAAIGAEFGEQLDVTRPLDFDGAGSDDHAAHTYPIVNDILGENIDQPRYTDRVSEFLGGVAIVINDIDPPVSTDDVAKRIDRMRAQPDSANYVGREVGVFGLKPADPIDPSQGYVSVAVAVYDPQLSFFDVDFDLWDRGLAQAEWRLVSQALQRQTSLEQVSSYSSAVAATLAAAAVMAVALSLLGILVYIWVRFGSLRYSMAAIVALVHDVAIALGLLALSAWIGRSALSSLLLIEEFRIDLGVVAALLTIIGYSLNDTIVILDRIRENRGKLPIPTADIVNRSINQTISRTVLTSFTTLLAVGIMYGAGGSGIRPFAFCLLAGIIVGTYSSVAIAAPLVVRFARPGEAAPGTQTAMTDKWIKQEPGGASA
ncbi:MAG: protein translocase subunit SecD [Planctomycetes bacterium]|nr:protein translocase subunit SecD [Planctomycetota bacterium]